MVNSVISSIGQGAVQGDLVNFTGTKIITGSTWPASDLALYVPFVLQRFFLALKMSCTNGTTRDSQAYLGIYDWEGNKIVDANTAQTGAASNSVLTIDITDTELAPGAYWMAMMLSGGTPGGSLTTTGPSLLSLISSGIREEATGGTLPDPMTPVDVGQQYVPYIDIHGVTTV